MWLISNALQINFEILKRCKSGFESELTFFGWEVIGQTTRPPRRWFFNSKFKHAIGKYWRAILKGYLGYCFTRLVYTVRLLMKYANLIKTSVCLSYFAIFCMIQNWTTNLKMIIPQNKNEDKYKNLTISNFQLLCSYKSINQYV